MHIQFNHIERGNKPREVEFAFNNFEQMGERYRKERKRRKNGDRATSAQYRQVMTQYGKDKIACEDDDRMKDQHYDAINGTWFNW